MIRDTDRPADSLYLIAHNNGTGRPYLGPRVLGLGLAGALLGELALTGLVHLDEDRMAYGLALRPYLRRVRHYARGLHIAGWCPLSGRTVLREDAATPCPRCEVVGVEEVPEPLQRSMWEVIQRERTPRSVRDWLNVFARNAGDAVAGRLAHDGWLVGEQRRTLTGRRRVHWRPADSVEAGMPARTLQLVVQGRKEPDEHRRLVAGLVDALGLTPSVLDIDARDGLTVHAGSLSAPLLQLIAQTKESADSDVIARTG